MRAEAHLNELSRKHRVLEEKIAKEMSRPTPDPLQITELKRRKLRLKDLMNRLEKSRPD